MVRTPLFDDDDGAKDVELSAAERELIIEALKHQIAYKRATRSSNQALNDLLERFEILREE